MLDICTTQTKRKQTPNEITQESDQVRVSRDVKCVEFSLSQYPQAFSRIDQVMWPKFKGYCYRNIKYYNVAYRNSPLQHREVFTSKANL